MGTAHYIKFNEKKSIYYKSGFKKYSLNFTKLKKRVKILSYLQENVMISLGSVGILIRDDGSGRRSFFSHPERESLGVLSGALGQNGSQCRTTYFDLLDLEQEHFLVI